MAQQRPDAVMKLPGVPYKVGLILGILIATTGCASPTPVPENRAIATGPFQAQSLTSSPRFSGGGPDAEKYGATEGYPVKAISRLPFFVGSFSHLDQLLEGRTIRRAASPSRLLRAPTEPALRYEYQGETRSLDDYLARNPATGLLIARDDTILVERYQYARTDRHRLTSFSMAKTVTAMLIGIALAENLIRSIDDPAAIYLPALADTEYGRTSLRHLLQMSSGVRFLENFSGQDDAARLFAATVLQQGPGGVAAVKPYNERARWSGAVFSYASVETQVLGLVLRSVVGRPVAEYFRDRIWEPIGAEADATSPGLSTPRGRRRPTAVSTRCCATTRDSVCCSRTTVGSATGRSSRRSGCTRLRPSPRATGTSREYGTAPASAMAIRPGSFPASGECSP